MNTVTVIGAGLAGCEAAHQLAKRGIQVKLYEMKPKKMSPAPHYPGFAELVCSNSLKADRLGSAAGMLKAEMRMFDSVVLEAAARFSVPAGGALAVERTAFSDYITQKITADKNIEAAGNVVEKETQKETAMESETPKDREVEPGGYLTEETTKEKTVNNVVEENTQSNVSKKDYLYGLSSEAAAQIKTLKFNKNSKLIWPVEGSIIMPYDVKNTVYYATLDEYKTNPGIVIQSSKGTAIKAAADGVITKITQDDELGVVIS